MSMATHAKASITPLYGWRYQDDQCSRLVETATATHMFLNLKVMKYKWFITEEWNEGDQMAHGRRRSRVVAYGLMSTKDIKNVKWYMERYSPYDYTDTMEYDTKEEYEKMLTTLEENGSEINRDESQQTLT